MTEARLMKGKIHEARQELDQLPVSLAIQDAETRWDVGIVRGRVQSAEGNLPEAHRTLNSVLRESSRSSARKEIFEARLGLANVETDHGNRKKELDRVYREASDNGYELIAMEARKETSAPVLR